MMPHLISECWTIYSDKKHIKPKLFDEDMELIQDENNGTTETPATMVQ